ncbi:MAG: hypothetical protein KDA51_11865, partial [Planctomycetales bacterium]|nr:hypothetical protein [Planctomycetales bacterium]
MDARSGEEVSSDTIYDSYSLSSRFSPDGHRLVTTCHDGVIRLYDVENGQLRLVQTSFIPAANARFSPNGSAIAVGLEDRQAAGVLDSSSLTLIANALPSPVVKSGDLFGGDDDFDGDLPAVAWSADGRHLFAGGSAARWGQTFVLRWAVGEWMQSSELPAANARIMDLTPLHDGGMLFAAADPAWGVLDGAGNVVRRHGGNLANFRGQEKVLGLSHDAQRVRFGYRFGGADAHVFDVAARSVGVDDSSLESARTAAPGLQITDWMGESEIRLNGQALSIGTGDVVRSLAIAPDSAHFALGANWSLRLYRRDGT